MAIIIENGSAVGEDGIALIVIEVIETFYGPAHQANDIPQAGSQPAVGIECVERLHGGRHSQRLPFQADGKGAVPRGNDNLIVDIRTIAGIVPPGNFLFIQRDASPGTVDIPGGELVINLFLLDDLLFQRPAEKIRHSDGKLNVKPPQGAVGAVDKGEGVDIDADNKRLVLRHSEVFQCVGILFKGDDPAAQPLCGELIHFSLCGEDFDGSHNIIDRRVIVAEGQGILLFLQCLDGFDPIGDTSPPAAKQRQAQAQDKHKAQQTLRNAAPGRISASVYNGFRYR